MVIFKAVRPLSAHDYPRLSSILSSIPADNDPIDSFRSKSEANVRELNRGKKCDILESFLGRIYEVEGGIH